MSRDSVSLLLNRLYVLDRDEGICCLCGQQIAEDDVQVHHIVALVDGGGNAPSNLASLCSSCHRGQAHNHDPRVRAQVRTELLRFTGVLDPTDSPNVVEYTDDSWPPAIRTDRLWNPVLRPEVAQQLLDSYAAQGA